MSMIINVPRVLKVTTKVPVCPINPEERTPPTKFPGVPVFENHTGLSVVEFKVSDWKMLVEFMHTMCKSTGSLLTKIIESPMAMVTFEGMYDKNETPRAALPPPIERGRCGCWN